ncbi:hypothetical protein B5808_08770 [Cnuibacter physcomitrellae]|uniref:Pyridoxamine 5'-phosphate oxidase putative domain-containing protein n=1 Tax=Cnuibacter physcomitrellae TaxID=1619308 RepID=A0A1X9LJB8_9MICO|nr:hypothetical protein B5808_08770 [Cnuibacter physcomitrellae]
MPHDYPFPPEDPHADDVHPLTEQDCWARLSRSGLGRLAVIDPQGADIFPINYLVHDSQVLFRSAPGTKIVSLTADPRVAFESDGIHDRVRWSVVVRGGGGGSTSAGPFSPACRAGAGPRTRPPGSDVRGPASRGGWRRSSSPSSPPVPAALRSAGSSSPDR